MLENFKTKLSEIFESMDYSAAINEEIAGESKTKFAHQGADGKSYTVEVEKSENEFYVYDESGKKIDIFQPDMIDLDGGVKSNIRKAIVDQYRQNNTQGSEEKPI